MAIICFLWSNGVLMRAVANYFGIDYLDRDADDLLNSSIMQTAFSIFWSIFGLVTMILSSRKSWRWFWTFGAVILFIVVVKLFTIDMSNSETITRIVFFMVVGLFFLAVGYFSPMPPPKDRMARIDNP